MKITDKPAEIRAMSDAELRDGALQIKHNGFRVLCENEIKHRAETRTKGDAAVQEAIGQRSLRTSQVNLAVAGVTLVVALLTYQQSCQNRGEFGSPPEVELAAPTESEKVKPLAEEVVPAPTPTEEEAPHQPVAPPSPALPPP